MCKKISLQYTSVMIYKMWVDINFHLYYIYFCIIEISYTCKYSCINYNFYFLKKTEVIHLI